MSSILQACQLQTGYRGTPLGCAFNLELKQGETLVLLGANGSGKTTLIKTLLGLLTPISGTVLLRGQPLAQWPIAQRAKLLAYVPQSLHSDLSFLVEEVVLMARSAGRSIFSAPSNTDKKIVYECLQQLQIDHLAKYSYNQLSGGQQQLVLLARAMAQQAEILILDEPTANLDFANQIMVVEQIKRLQQAGSSILLCSHQPQQAQQLAQRVAYCKQGGIVDCGDVTSMLAIERLAELYDLDAKQLKDYLSWQQPNP